MTFQVLTAFWAVSFLFVITPGVDWAYAISSGTKGRMVIPAVAGLLIGHFIATSVVAAGMGAFVSSNPITLKVLTTVGSLYLVWLGINLLFKPSALNTSESYELASWKYWTKNGILVSGLNPKVFLLFLALLPQFTDPASSWSLPTQMLTLGLIHIFSSGVVYLFVGFSSQVLLGSRPHAVRMVSRLSGLLMIVIAITLLMNQELF